MKLYTYLALILAIIAIGAVGYGIMHAVVYMVPMSENPNYTIYALMALAITTLGIIVPYLMLKAGFAAARLGDRRQKPILLKDLPKTQPQLQK